MDFIKKIFGLTNKNLMLVCSLVIFQCISSVYILISQRTGMNMDLQVIILYGLMVIAFFSGFFNIIKYTVNNESGKLRFFEGVGDYFLPMCGIFILSFIFYSLGSIISIVIAEKFLGGIQPIISFVSNILNNPATAAELIKTVDPSLILSVELWILIISAIWAIIAFVLLYWIPVLFITNQRNVFKSLFQSLSFLFKNFLKTLLFALAFLVIIILVSLLESITLNIPAISAIFSILSYYFTIVFLFGVFLIYKDKISSNDGNI